jgi:hypothetical protein
MELQGFPTILDSLLALVQSSESSHSSAIVLETQLDDWPLPTGAKRFQPADSKLSRFGECSEVKALVVGAFEPSNIRLFGRGQVGKLLLRKPGSGSGLVNEFAGFVVSIFFRSSSWTGRACGAVRALGLILQAIRNTL